MKHMICIAIALTVMVANATAQANEPSENAPPDTPTVKRFFFGLEGGYTKNYLITNISSLAFTEYKPVSGYTIGVPLEYKINDWLAIYSNPNLTQKNYQYQRTNFFQGVYEKYTNSYLQVPLAGRVYFGGRRLKGFLNGGFYAGYWTAGHIAGTIPNTLDMTNGSASNPTTVFGFLNPYNFNEKYAFNTKKDNRTEFGWLAGVGIKYQLTDAWQIFSEGRLSTSMTDQQKKYMINQVPRYNQTYTITLGFLVNLKALTGKSDN